MFSTSSSLSKTLNTRQKLAFPHDSSSTSAVGLLWRKASFSVVMGSPFIKQVGVLGSELLAASALFQIP